MLTVRRVEEKAVPNVSSPPIQSNLKGIIIPCISKREGVHARSGGVLDRKVSLGDGYKYI